MGRDGTKYAFPGVAIGNGGSAIIDHNQIGADLIRIVFESLRDGHVPLPVLSSSTAASIIQTKNNCPPVGNSTDDPSLPKECQSILAFSGGNSKLRYQWLMNPYIDNGWVSLDIDKSDFETIEAKARNTESTVGSAVGKAIRGGSWGALNNEAVAKFIETAAGVIARHTAQRAGWCALYSEQTR